MLALSRIAAVPDGASPPVGARRLGKAARASITPFLAMLSTLSPRKTDKVAEAKSQAIPPREQSALLAKFLLKGDQVLQAKAVPADTGKGLGGQVAEKAKLPGRDAEWVAQAREKPGKAKSRAVDDEGRLGSVAAAASLDAQAGTKVAANRIHALAAGAGTRGANDSSGIEVTGTGSAEGKDGVRVSIVDMRLKARTEGSSRREGARSGSDGDASTGSSKAERATAGAQGGNDPALSAGRLAAPSDARAEFAAPASNEGARSASQSFTDSLASRLREGAADIVRSAQVVMRDGGLGLIRLRLEPESLGGVKIELKLAEKQISGKIFVESDIAREAFKSSLDALKDAFAECGFETTSLEVEVRNGMASGAGPDGRDPGKARTDEGPYWSRSLRELDAAVPALASVSRDGLLNVIV
ncbi:MAG: hypothetical protein CVV51_14220 [Spirochaetae bacterium HGW-Spirochaetae-7]|jgi:hypothetical protein|nr:MAG: hypothetical protein CVV51_14220 [Spirochaetae bacterium HGW-Spirochaetae-7]